MKKVCLIAVLALLLFAATGFSETGIGATAHYPIFFTEKGEKPQLDDLLVGASLRYKRSILLMDMTGLYAVQGHLVAGLLEGGVCFDLLLFRLALAGGLDALYNWDIEYFTWGPNVKANVDVKLGPATIGLSAVLPLTSLITDDEDRAGDLRVVFSGISLNVMFWF
jgi:hypothetical protein